MEYNSLGQLKRTEADVYWDKVDSPISGMDGKYKGNAYARVKETYIYDLRGRISSHSVSAYGRCDESPVDHLRDWSWYWIRSQNGSIDFVHTESNIQYNSVGATIYYDYTTKTWKVIHGHHSGIRSVSGHGKVAHFDEYLRPVDTTTTWNKSDGHGWDRYTDIEYDSKGKRSSAIYEYYSYMIYISKSGGLFGSSTVTTIVETEGKDNVTYEYDEYGSLTKTNRDEIWKDEKIHVSSSSSFFSKLCNIIVQTVLRVVLNMILPGVGELICAALASFIMTLANGGSIKDALKSAGMTALYQIGIQLGQQVMDNLMAGPDSADPGLTEATEGVGETAESGASDSVSQGAASGSSAGGSFIQTAFTGVKNLVVDISKSITSGIGGLFDSVKELFSSSIGDLIKSVYKFAKDLFFKPVYALTSSKLEMLTLMKDLKEIVIKSFREALVAHIAEKNDLNAFQTQLLRASIMNPTALFTLEGFGAQLAYVEINLAYAGIAFGSSKIDTKDEYWNTFFRGFTEGAAERYVEFLQRGP